MNKQKEILKNPTNKLIAVDLDGVLCKGEFWGEEEPKPISEMIKLVENIYKKGAHIVIYTARHRSWYQQTEAWLIKNNVFYHSISMEKMGADLYIDDKCINVKDISISYEINNK